MATELTTGDMVQARVVTRDVTGGENYNIYNFRVINVVGTPLDTDFATQLDTLIAPLYKAFLPTTSNYDGIEISLVNKTLRPVQPASVYTSASSGPGTIAENSMAGQVAGMISWATNLSGQAYRGRNYLGSVPVTMITAAGVPSSAYVTLIGTLALNLFTFTGFTVGASTLLCALSIWHRVHQLYTIITSFYIPGKFGTQRRRGTYGKNKPPPI